MAINDDASDKLLTGYKGVENPVGELCFLI